MNSTISIPTLLDVALSLTFIFFIVSMFVSGIWEFIGTVIRDARATLLRRSLEQMLNSKEFANYIYNHPLIRGSIVIRPQQTLEAWFNRTVQRVTVVSNDKPDNNSTSTGNDPGSSTITSENVILKPNASIEERIKPLKDRLTVIAAKTINSIDKKADEVHVINYPTYIAPSVFSYILLDLLKEISSPDIDFNKEAQDPQFAKIQAWINSLGSEDSPSTFNKDVRGELKRILDALVQDAKNVKELIANIENWYTEYMNRLTGYYKAYSQQGVRIVAIVMVVLFNLDAFNLTIRLYKDQPLREATVSEAISFTEAIRDTLKKKQNSQLMAYYDLGIRTQFDKDFQALVKHSRATGKKDSLTHADSLTLKKLIHHRDSLMNDKHKMAMLIQPSDTLSTQFAFLQAEKDYLDQLPFGWTRLRSDYSKSQHHLLFGLTVFIGWLLMVAAVSFGAPFWFDLLLKFVNIRNAGKNPADKK
jgi:hypothetical protein